MTVDKITFGDILRSAEIDDLDAALLRLQQIAGIDGGDSVATVFSGGEAEAWPSSTRDERTSMLAYWLSIEQQ